MDELERRTRAESPEGRQLADDIAENPICCLTFDPAIPAAVVVWRRYATSLQLRFINEKLLELIVKHRARKLLADDTGFSAVDRADQAWIFQEWMPRAVEAGLKVVASKRPAGYYGRVTVQNVQAHLEPIKIEVFEDLPSAREWLIRYEA